MAKVLYIKANPKTTEESRTFQISEAFVAAYKKHNPDDEIIILDLYKEGITFLTDANVMIHTPSPEIKKDHPVLKYTYQFLEADKYIFAEPFWNLNIPAILKAYIDYVCVNTVTFRYTDKGAEGLCLGKKAINITTRGGNYSSEFTAGWEYGDRYLRTILGFLGIIDYQTIFAEELDVIGQDVDGKVRAAIEKAEKAAAEF